MKAIIKKVYNKIFLSKEIESIDISDEYINHLCYANAGFLHRGNLYLINHAIKNMPANTCIVEIGVFCGLSTNIINYYLKANKKDYSIYNADIWKLYTYDPEMKLGSSEMTHTDYRNNLISIYKNNISLFSSIDNIFTFEMYSDNLFKLWEGESLKDLWNRTVSVNEPIGFAYIDGSHLYEQAKKDFINVDRYLQKGGFILFDDSFNEVYIKDDCEVSLLMKEIKSQYADRYEVIAQNPNYLFRKLK